MTPDFLQVTQTLLEGFGTTIFIFVVSFVFSIPLGMLFTFFSLRKWKAVQKIMQLFLWIIRGTPLMLQIIAVFYIPGLVFNVQGFERMVAVIVAIVINYAVYFSEIFRASYQTIDVGQREAAQALGFSRPQTFFRVHLLQIIKRSLPPLANETISLVKDTALARVLAITEVLYSAQKLVATYAIIYTLFYTAVFYLVFNCFISILYKFAEKKLSYYEG